MKNLSVLLISIFVLCNVVCAQMYSVKDSTDGRGQKCKVFTHCIKSKGNKTKTVSYIFTEKRSDISLGCEVWRFSDTEKTPMEYFAVASYTKDESGRMNYNSILPYISICQAGQRTILSFECPFIVINPDRADEKIIETKNLYGKITDNSIELVNY